MKSKCCKDKIIAIDGGGYFCNNCGTPCNVTDWHTVKIKPLSVNEMYIHKAVKNAKEKWCVKRILSGKARDWKTDVHNLLPRKLNCEGKLRLEIVLAYSSANSDTDNGVKSIQDALQSKYGFNDNKIFELEARKINVKKGMEYFQFRLIELDNEQDNSTP